MRRRWIATIFGLAACGSVAAPPTPDAPDAHDAGLDGIPTAAPPPVLVKAARGHAAASATLTIPLTIPGGADRLLIVSVGVGSLCPASDPTIATVTGVSYAGTPLVRLDTIVGTPCSANVTRSEQWTQVAPALGANDVVITLSSDAVTLHGGALAFTGVNQTTPVRASATTSGAGTTAMATVASAIGDLVVSSVGQGGSITAPGSGQTAAFIQNVSNGNTLDNSAASTAVAAGPATAMSWSFGAEDEWQMIVSSLRAP